MNIKLSLATPLTIAALCAAAIKPAAAQRAIAPDYIRPVVEGASITADAPLMRTVAVYRFTSPRQLGIPAEVTLSDSTGQLVATFRLPGAHSASPMLVEVLDTDLVLQGETPVGVLTLVLFQQATAEVASGFIGRWTIAGRTGELRGGSLR
jgi:hypothetical protein